MHFVLVIHAGAIDDPRSKFSKELEETFKKGMKAPACAGIIHSDFEKGFIRCETMSFEDLQTYGSELKGWSMARNKTSELRPNEGITMLAPSTMLPKAIQ